MKPDYWEAYYKSGVLVSCPTNPEPNYGLEVREAWVSFFSALPDGGRILDLGTGNGPVALIAKETAAELQRHYVIDGIDLARIDPPRFVPDGDNLLSGISFHAGISTEALPFADGSFDAISGQYILEYTALPGTLAECARVLKPQGRCRFILHHLDSVIVGNAAESLRQAELVVHDTGTLRHFRHYCERAHGAPARAAAARRKLLAAGETLQAAARESKNPLLLRFVIDSVSALLANRSRLGRGSMLAQTAQLERELNHWVQRLRDLVAAALSPEEMGAAIACAAGLGFRAIEREPQWQDGDKLVGWRLTMSGAH